MDHKSSTATEPKDTSHKNLVVFLWAALRRKLNVSAFAAHPSPLALRRHATHTPGVHTPCPPQTRRSGPSGRRPWCRRGSPDPPWESAPRRSAPATTGADRAAGAVTLRDRAVGPLRTSSEKRRIKSVSMHHRRVADKTATPMQAEMGHSATCRASLERHQTARAAKLVRWDPRGGTSSSYRTSGRRLTTRTNAAAAAHAPGPLATHDERQLPRDHAVTRGRESVHQRGPHHLRRVARNVDDAHIWMTLSVPQEGTSLGRLHAGRA